MTTWEAQLDRAINRRFDEMVAIRRQLHANPEPSGEEYKSSLLLYQELADEKLHVRMGPEGRGVVVDSARGENGDDARGLLALRADIDALRIRDEKQVEYRSKCDGVMHACGHDAHTAILFGVVAALRDVQQQGALPWPIRFRGIFQPSEETCQGAKEMIGIGALEGVSAIISNHMDPTRKVGHIGFRPGVLTANCDDMRIRILGRGGHAARPHEAQDPIAAAAQMINALYLFIPRKTDSLDAVVVTVGQVIGGDNPNVIPERVELLGTMRTLDRRVREKTIENIQRLADGVGQTSGTNIEVEFSHGAMSVDNDPQLVSLLRRAAIDALGVEHLEDIPRPSMGAEDFAYYLEHVPGAMLRIGCASSRAGGSALHTPTFDIDEEALRVAARVMARGVIMWWEPQPDPSDDARFIHEGI